MSKSRNRSPDYLEIPGNRAVLERLKAKMLARDVVVLAGAGTSAPMWPLWDQALDLMIDFAFEEGLATRLQISDWREMSDHELRAQSVRTALGNDHYSEFIRSTFERPENVEVTYTPQHEVIVTRNCKAIITTNFDRGLQDARLRLRNDVPDTGYTNAQDLDAISVWLTNEVFLEGHLPLLHLHGAIDRPLTTVFTKSDYQRLYKKRIFQDMVRGLWQQQHVLVVGFSFADVSFSALLQIANDNRRTGALPLRHFAIVPLNSTTEYSPQLRRDIESNYGVQPIFYVVHDELSNSHEEVLEVMRSLPMSSTLNTRSSNGDPKPIDVFHEVHAGTDDEYFVETPGAFERLSKWAADPTVRVIAVTGLGGTGKTALVSHWIKSFKTVSGANFASGIYWSFYEDPSPESFFKRFNDAMDTALGTYDKDVDEWQHAGDIVNEYPLLIVLDGLEVIQEIRGNESYGSLVHSRMRSFLKSVLHSGKSLVVATSRFPLADLESEMGNGARWMLVSGLTPDQGVKLLESLGLSDRMMLKQIAIGLNGHPLALRVFADRVRNFGNEPLALLNSVISKSSSHIESKLAHLLEDYFSLMDDAEKEVLSVISLFSSPIGADTVLEIHLGHSGPQKSTLASPLTTFQIVLILNSFVSRGIATKSDIASGVAFTCHPVIRDACRSSVLSNDQGLVTLGVAFLEARPGGVIKEELSNIHEAVILLLKTGQWDKAYSLLQTRMYDGEAYLSIPGLSEAMEVTEIILSTDVISQSLEKRGDRSGSAIIEFLLIGAEASRLCGNVALAKRAVSAYEEFNLEMARQDYGDSWTADVESDIQLNSSRITFDICVDSGDLMSAIPKSSGPLYEVDDQVTELAHIYSLQGRYEEATRFFDYARRAATFGIERTGDTGDLLGFQAVWWVEHLIAVGDPTQALAASVSNEASCRREPTYPTWSASLRLVGCAHLLNGNLRDARAEIDRSLEIAEETTQLRMFVECLLANSTISIVEGEYFRARDLVVEANTYCTSRLWPLMEADALWLKSQIWRLADWDSEYADYLSAESETVRLSHGYLRNMYDSLLRGFDLVS